MNKILRLGFMLLAALTFTQASAQQTYTHTFASGDIKAVGDATLTGITWNVDAVWNANSYFGFDTANSPSKGFQFGSANNSAQSVTLKTSGISGIISSVVVNAATASSTTATLDVTVGGQSTGAKSLSTSSTDYTFTPNASGELAIILSQPSTKKALYIKSITVTYAAAGDFVASPTITGNELFVGSTTVTLDASGSTIYYTTNGADPTTSSTAYTAPFQLTGTATVKAIAVKDGKTSTVASKTFTAAIQTSDIDDFKSQSTGTVAVLNLENAKVLYASADGSRVYVKDGTGNLLLYNAGLSLKTGDVLNGWVAGKVDNFNGNIQLAKNDLTNKDNLKVVAGDPVEAPEKTISEVMTSSYISGLVKITGVTLSTETSGTSTVTYANQNGAKIQVYDQFKVLTDQSLITGEQLHTITGIVMVYNTTYEIAPISLEGMITTGINDIKTSTNQDANAPVYNLAGQRVDTTFKGVVLKNGKKYIQK
jgi:hypothetical protein